MMDLFSVLQLLSWVAVGTVLFILMATMGFDFGAGMLARFVGKTDNERRAIINVVAPTWDGNQVWLIIAGACLFAIWPRVYAASFSGLYFGVLVVLWSLFMRPVAFEYRSKIETTKWRGFWDWMLFFGSFLPILILGVVIGNLFLGMPFQFDPESLRFFYGAQGVDGAEPALLSLILLLMPFALLFGIFAVIMSLMHGAAYCAMRTDGVLYERFKKIRSVCAILFILLFALAGIWLCFIPGFHWAPSAVISSFSDSVNHPLNGAVVSITIGGWLSNYAEYPWMVVAPILGFTGAIMVIVLGNKGKAVGAFCGSLVALFGAVFTMGFSLFPFLMPSTLSPDQSLTIWNSSSSQLSLTGILIVALIMLPIIFSYTTFVYKKMWGRDDRMNAEEVESRKYELY
jgi:cytochrome bd ubiquinol oxidase subunit II